MFYFLLLRPSFIFEDVRSKCKNYLLVFLCDSFTLGLNDLFSGIKDLKGDHSLPCASMGYLRKIVKMDLNPFLTDQR